MNPSYTNEVGASAGNFAGAPIASGGDIILGAPEKKSRKWIIFLILGVVIVAAAIVVAVILNAKKLTSKTAGADLAELVSYIENGPDGTTENTGESSETSDEADDETDTELADVIYAIRIKDNSKSEIENYYNTLREKAEKVVSKISSDDATEYQLALRILENMINYRAVSETVVEVAKTGTDKMKQYLAENFGCDEVDGIMKTVCWLEKTYYEDVASEYFLYAEHGCYQNNSYDLDCLNNVSEDLESTIEPPKEALGRMTRYAVLRTLSSEIKTLNQKMLEQEK